jgi:trans-feruloyl-CoA hydratase/vanillin synthase
MAEAKLGGSTVKVEFDEGIAWVFLNRPEKRNAMSPTLNSEMTETLEALEIDERCKVLVLTGAGDAFSAGMDLKEFFRESDVKPAEEWNQIARQATIWQLDRLKWFPKVTIAMVNGWCFGGAFNPVVSCDIAVAADEATFGLSEINWGIIPAGNVLRSVASRMREVDGLYLALSGDTFTGKDAARMGLVTFSEDARARAQARRQEPNCRARHQARLSQDAGDVLAGFGGLPDGEARPDAADGSRAGPPKGHEPVPRREELPARAGGLQAEVMTTS